MKLPNTELAFVERGKIVDYLLNPSHRYGASKARFFTSLGFHLQEWERLAAALLEHGRRDEVSKTKETGFGPRYEVEGNVTGPNGRQAHVRTVWQVDKGQTHLNSCNLLKINNDLVGGLVGTARRAVRGGRLGEATLP
jgi:hypothetical protein